MPHSQIAINKLVRAVENGEMSEQELDKHARKVLDVVFKYAREGKEKPEVDFDKHHELARQAALRCAVLLKNEGETLPVAQSKSVAVLGAWAEKPVFQGTGCAIVNARSKDIPLDELKKIYDNISYAPGYADPKVVDEAMIAQAAELAAKADVAIVFGGAMLTPETDDYNRKDLCLESAHNALIKSVAKVNPNTVVVLMNCESVEMPWIDDVKAVLDLWYCGEGCGWAVAQLLSGKANPCGKLPVTMPKRLCDCPDYLHFPGENHRQIYSEGIYVGYRYYDKKEIDPLFPFGHGLSYTSFEYSALELSADSISIPEKLTVSCTVTNTGSTKGSEVVQLYISDGHSRLHRPLRELKAFEKTELMPGEGKKVSFLLDKRCFAYYDPCFADWIVDSGEFTISIGSSSRDIRLSAAVNVNEPVKRNLPITADSHYLEVFENEKARDIFFETLAEWGWLKKEDVTEALIQKFKNSFWGIAQHLDLLLPCQLTEEMLEELIRRLNTAV